MGETGIDRGERAGGRRRPPAVVVAPAVEGAIRLDGARELRAGAHRHESPRGSGGATEGIGAPAHGRAVRPDAAAVVTARAHGAADEPSRGGRGLPGYIAAPAHGGAVGPHTARVPVTRAHRGEA